MRFTSSVGSQSGRRRRQRLPAVRAGISASTAMMPLIFPAARAAVNDGALCSPARRAAPKALGPGKKIDNLRACSNAQPQRPPRRDAVFPQIITALLKSPKGTPDRIGNRDSLDGNGFFQPVGGSAEPATKTFAPFRHASRTARAIIAPSSTRSASTTTTQSASRTSAMEAALSARTVATAATALSASRSLKKQRESVSHGLGKLRQHDVPLQGETG